MIVESDHSLRPTAAEMERYFSSIEDLFKRTLEYVPAENPLDTWFFICLSVLFLSIFPLVPLIIWALLRWLYPYATLMVHALAIPIGSFSFWWVTCIAGSVSSLFILGRIQSRVEPKKEPDLLSGPGLRFALSYALSEELDKFTRNKLPKHIDQAFDYWIRLRRQLEQLLGTYGRNRYTLDFPVFPAAPTEVPGSADGIAYPKPSTETRVSRHNSFSFFGQITRYKEQFSWFRLDPDTNRIMAAFDSLPAKVQGRIGDKKDIRTLSELFFKLSRYLYTTIPELCDDEIIPAKSLVDYEERALMAMVEVTESLADYSPERRRPQGKEKVKSLVVRVSNWMFALFVSDNLLIKFFSWWAMTQILVIGGVVAALHYVPDLKPEIWVPLLLPTPLLVAAAALAAPLRSKP